jgi:hypothetical protein
MSGPVARWVVSVAGWAAAFAAYVAAYYGLIYPVWLLNPLSGRPAVVATYEFGGRFAEWVFHPMNVVDRGLRPEWFAGFPARPPWDRPDGGF